MENNRLFLIGLIFLYSVCISCNKMVYNTISQGQGRLANSNVGDSEVEHTTIDSLKVFSPSDTTIWHTVYDTYSFNSKPIEVYYNTYDREPLQAQIEKAEPFFNKLQAYHAKIRNLLRDDFVDEGLTYKYVKDYLIQKEETSYDYETITHIGNFRAKSRIALGMLKINRIRIFSPSNLPIDSNIAAGYVLDYSIEDYGSIAFLAIHIKENGDFTEITIEGLSSPKEFISPWEK